MRRIWLATMGLFIMPTLAGADPGQDWPGGYDHMMWGAGHGVFGWLMMLVFWAIVIALIVFAVKGVSGKRGQDTRRDAMDTLRERFAAGEIDEEEFERRRKILEK